MVSVGANGSEPYPREREIILPACHRPHADSNADPEFVASLLHLHSASVGIELAHQAVSVLFCGCRNMGDKGLDQVPTGSFESFRTAEIRGVRLNEGRIEVVLADQEAQSVPHPRLTIVRAIFGIRLCSLLMIPRRTGGTGKRSQLFNRAE